MNDLNRQFNELIEAKHACQTLINHQLKRNLSYKGIEKVLSGVMLELKAFIEKNPAIK